jgi:P27 family predicted phage terminase small subunit
MPGPAPKPEHLRQGHRKRPALTVSGPSVPVDVPAPPSGLLKVTSARWDAFWRSPVAAAADPVTDLPAVERLFRAYDEVERAGRAFRKGRIVQGSTGQPVLNPLSRYIAQLTSEITGLEDRLGLTPKARLALGIQMGEARRSLNDLIQEAGYDD